MNVTGKGVIVNVVPPECMPIDEHGNRADIVMDPLSTVGRMNLGRLYEQYINAAGRDLTKRIISDLASADPAIPTMEKTKLIARLEKLEVEAPDTFDLLWKYLMGFYYITSPRLHRGIHNTEKRAKHLASIVTKGIYLYIPTDSERESKWIVSELEKSYRPVYGPISYIGNSGRRVTTKKPMRIGSVYFMLLEKTGDDWTAVSSGKLQHFGVLSQITNSDKYSEPSRRQAIRALGESETRIFVAYVGAKITADIMDRSNNPETHKYVVQSILHANKPTNIKEVVDRKLIPLGGARPLQLIRHIAMCAGWKFTYRPYQSQSKFG